MWQAKQRVARGFGTTGIKLPGGIQLTDTTGEHCPMIPSTPSTERMCQAAGGLQIDRERERVSE